MADVSKGGFWSRRSSSTKPSMEAESESRWTNQDLLRVPQRAEDQHFEIIGDTGSGKTTIIIQMLCQIQVRDILRLFTIRLVSSSNASTRITRRYCPESARPALPVLGASEELSGMRKRERSRLRFSSRRTTKRANLSLKVRKRFLPICCSICRRRNNWSTGCRTRKRSTGGSRIPMASLIHPSAPQQRSGVLASLSLVADSFRLLPEGRCSQNGTPASGRKNA